MEFLRVFLAVAGGAFAIAGALIARRWFVAVPLVGWPVFYLGLYAGWWGAGVGDGWQLIMVTVTAASALGAAAGVFLSKRLRRMWS